MKYPIDQPAHWRHRLIRWASRQTGSLIVLDSCAQPEPCDLGHFEILMAVGARRRFELAAGGPLDRDALMQWSAQKGASGWSFFVSGYELGERFEVASGANLPRTLGWPDLVLIEPQVVLGLTRTGELEICAPDCEALWREIQAESNEPYQPSQLSVSWTTETESLSRRQHHQSVTDIQGQIARGDFYEINLCTETRLHHCRMANPFDWHQQLLSRSPSPFSAFVQLDSYHLLCASPERFLRRKADHLYSQPIKGTSARHTLPDQDQLSKDYLQNSLKERAEHIMIVDLVRNDLSKLCQTGSVRVQELCGIYGYRQVYQMISTVVGQQRDDTHLLPLLEALFPMGSMTGAPKKMVMNAIAHYEGVAREWFSGTVGYCDPSGNMDSNVVIRSLMYDSAAEVAKYCVGGAITMDSDPEAEYQECQLKASAITALLKEHRLDSVQADPATFMR